MITHKPNGKKRNIALHRGLKLLFLPFFCARIAQRQQKRSHQQQGDSYRYQLSPHFAPKVFSKWKDCVFRQDEHRHKHHRIDKDAGEAAFEYLLPQRRKFALVFGGRLRIVGKKSHQPAWKVLLKPSVYGVAELDKVGSEEGGDDRHRYDDRVEVGVYHSETHAKGGYDK